MSGFILMHREALEHPLFAKDAQRLGAWLWMVARACWKPTKFNVQGKTVEIGRGQFCCTVRELGDAWGMSKSAVDRFLTRLRTETMIETDSGTGRLIITICNYAKYQDVGNEAGTDAGTPTGTAAGQQRDTKEQGNKGTREEEPNGSPSQTASKRAAKVSAVPRPDDVSEEVWADFLILRAKHKADVTPTALKGFRREADRVGWPLERAIEESILRGWRGFNAEWVKKDDRSNNRGTAGSRYEPDGAVLELQRRTGLAGYQPASGPAGRWDDEPASGADRHADTGASARLI
jgi:hypothetical protein